MKDNEGKTMLRNLNSDNVTIITIFVMISLCLIDNGKAMAIAGIDFPYEEDLDFSEVQQIIDAGQFDEAISYLNSEVLEWYPENAEALTLKAFSLRNLGQNDYAMETYIAALVSNPEHKGALEYQGELFLKLGDIGAAQNNLGKLKKLCPRGCEAHDKLQSAIERFKDGKLSWLP